MLSHATNKNEFLFDPEYETSSLWFLRDSVRISRYMLFVQPVRYWSILGKYALATIE